MQTMIGKWEKMKMSKQNGAQTKTTKKSLFKKSKLGFSQNTQKVKDKSQDKGSKINDSQYETQWASMHLISKNVVQ